jgi:hypothetical protein
MTRDQVLVRLKDERAIFDSKVAALPAASFDVAPPGFAHTPKEIVAHVSAYEDLVVRRLRAARAGQTTEFDRDRAGWEVFNERVWADVRSLDPEQVRARSAEVFADLVTELETVTDEEFNATVGVTAMIDPAWLAGSTLWEMIDVECWGHYPMHYPALEAAAAGASE